MCRIFAQIASKPWDPSDYLINSDCSLLAQSTAKKTALQKDGWGIASYSGASCRLYKSANPIYRETSILKKESQKAKSKIVIAHIRWASNPLKLPLKELIAEEHSQPFVDSSLSFAHNGTVNIAVRAREALGPFKSKLKGKNDSEIYFWMLKKWISKTHDIAMSLSSVANELWRLWPTTPPKEKKEFKTPYSGLNVTVSDGQRLYALCHSVMKYKRPSLCLKDQPYNRLAYRLNDSGDRLIVGSEKLSSESGWKVMPMHSMLEAWIADGKIKFKVREFKWN